MILTLELLAHSFLLHLANAHSDFVFFLRLLAFKTNVRTGWTDRRTDGCARPAMRFIRTAA